MNKCLEESIKETLEQINESEEFKRKLEAYIKNYFEQGAGQDDLQALINLVKIDKNDAEDEQ